MEKIIHAYYENNAIKLRRLVDQILKRFGQIPDREDFYSLANEVFAEVLKKYDTSRSFDAFLYSCLCNRIKSELRRRNRDKRRTDYLSVSFDVLLGNETGQMLGDLLACPFDLEKEVIGEDDYDDTKIEKYLQRLSKRQRAVVQLLASSYRAGEIQEILHITRKEYSDALTGIRSYENVSVLFTVGCGD